MRDEPIRWWCKRVDGTIVESITTAYEGHVGHVQCVPVLLWNEEA